VATRIRVGCRCGRSTASSTFSSTNIKLSSPKPILPEGAVHIGIGVPGRGWNKRSQAHRSAKAEAQPVRQKSGIERTPKIEPKATQLITPVARLKCLRKRFLPALLQDRFSRDAGIAERKPAAVYLQKLEDIGVLTSVKAGRERIFLNPKHLDLLRGAGRVICPKNRLFWTDIQDMSKTWTHRLGVTDGYNVVD